MKAGSGRRNKEGVTGRPAATLSMSYGFWKTLVSFFKCYALNKKVLKDLKGIEVAKMKVPVISATDDREPLLLKE